MKEFKMDIIVDYRDVDRFLTLKTDALLEMLGTVSMNQTVSLGYAPNYMEARGLVWVLYQWKTHLEEGRYYAEPLTFKTFVQFQKNLYSHRYYSIHAPDGRRIGYALATWLVIDVQQRRVARIPEDIEATYVKGNGEGVTEEQAEIMAALPPEVFRRIPRVEFNHEKSFEVRFSDIDGNGHVNNVKYVDWILESLTARDHEEFLVDNVIEDLTIVYKKEKYPLGWVTVRSRLDGMDSYHEIHDNQDNLLTLAKVHWKRRDT